MIGRTSYEAFYAGLPKDTFEPWEEVRPDSQAIWARIEWAVLAEGEQLRERLEDKTSALRVEIAAKQGAHNLIRILEMALRRAVRALDEEQVIQPESQIHHELKDALS